MSVFVFLWMCVYMCVKHVNTCVCVYMSMHMYVCVHVINSIRIAKASPLIWLSPHVPCSCCQGHPSCAFLLNFPGQEGLSLASLRLYAGRRFVFCLHGRMIKKSQENCP